MSSEAPSTQGEKNVLAEEFNSFSLLRFAFPTIFMMVFFGLYTVVDTIFVARGVNTDALSAINIVTPAINIIVGLATMLATGGSAVIARRMGSNKSVEARRNFTLIVAAAGVAGVVLAVSGSIFLDPLLQGLGASTDLLPYCRNYLGTLLFFTPMNMLQVVFACLFVTAGRPGLGMLINVAGGLANAFFDYLLIMVFPMGIAGAALATGIGYAVPAIAGLIFFSCNRRGTLCFIRPGFDAGVLKESVFNGSSEMVGQLATAVTTFLFNAAMLQLLGEDGVAAITIMIYSQFLLSTFFIGFSMGVAPVISYAYGCGDREKLKRIIGICLGVTVAASLAITTLTLVFGSTLVGIFSPQGSAVYPIARAGFLIFPFAFLFIGFNIFGSSMYTAVSNGGISAALSFSRNLLIALGIVALPGFLGVKGLWMAVPLAEFASFILALGLFLKTAGTCRQPKEILP